MGILDGFRVQKLIRNLGDPDLKVRITSIDELGEAGDARAVEPLIACLLAGENSGIVQARAIVALGKLGDRRATAPLLRMLLQRGERSPFSGIVRAKAAEALGQIGDSRAMPHLLSYFLEQGHHKGTDEGEVEEKVREALVRIGSSDPSALISAMEKGDPVTRAEAARALLHIGSGEAMEVMIAGLDDLNYAVRLQAAAYLEKCGDRRAIEPLTRSLKDVNRDVRSAARDALNAVNTRNRHSL